MSTAYLICMGSPGSVDPAQNAAAITQLLADLNAEAARLAWAGSTIAFYRRQETYVSISISRGDTPATLDDLRIFRDAQRAAASAEQDQPQQGRMF